MKHDCAHPLLAYKTIRSDIMLNIS